jgi:peptide/nickel transport system substrate-binding protein
VHHSLRAIRSSRRLVAVVATLAILAAACGGGGSSKPNTKGQPGSSTPVEGGSINYGIGAEHTGGFCGPIAQLAPEGIEENLTLFDTLMVPNDKGDMVPYLAESVSHSPDYMTWTIKLRPGIKFHNGEILDAEAVKTNFEEYRNGALFSFVFTNIAGEQVIDPLTVAINMKVPWVAFSSYLFSTGRLGMVAPSTLKDKTTCSNHPVGTGPFMFQEWKVNDHMTVVKNPNYWRKDSAGRPLPYLDSITFRIVIDPDQRLLALKTGQLDLIQTDNGETVFRARQDVSAGNLASVENQKAAEISYSMLRVDKAPFNDLTARQAVAYAADRNELNTINNHGVNTLSNTPFAPDVFGYLKEPVQPPVSFDLNKAKQLVSQYKAAHGGTFDFTLSSTNDPSTVRLAQLVQSQWQRAGMNVKLRNADQATLISQALGGDFQITLWRNHQGADPDTQYVWWHSNSPVNFGSIKDAEIDRAFDDARSNPDPNVRKADYETVQRVFGQKLYNLWSWYALWAYISKPNLHGIQGPPLPDGGTQQFQGSVHSMLGMYLSK